MSGLPNFVVIGAMKCATSSLHEQLAAQPGIFMSEPKEPNFFSDPDQWSRGLDWYSGLFTEGEGAHLRGESSTHYTKLPDYPETVERIRANLPEARFIYVMRSPIDRLTSQFIHEWTEREITGSLDDVMDRNPHLLSYSSYALQLRPYLEAFGPDRILPVFFEAIRAHPQRELERIARFLDYPDPVTWHDDLGARNVSRDRMRRSPLREAIVNQPILARLRRTLVPKALRNRIKDLWRMKERPEFSAAERGRVEARLDEDLAELSSWLGVDFTCANFSKLAADAEPRWTEKTPARK